MSNRLLFSRATRLQQHALLATPRLPAWAAVRADLDSHLLKDIGVSFAEAEAEANKPFWRE
jgi:hypothetical protein